MWWWFEKLEESHDRVLYAYSRESRQADGRIEVNKRTQDVNLLIPCESDRGSSFCESRACDKVYLLIAEHYPDRRQIACG